MWILKSYRLQFDSLSGKFQIVMPSTKIQFYQVKAKNAKYIRNLHIIQYIWKCRTILKIYSSLIPLLGASFGPGIGPSLWPPGAVWIPWMHASVLSTFLAILVDLSSSVNVSVNSKITQTIFKMDIRYPHNRHNIANNIQNICSGL